MAQKKSTTKKKSSGNSVKKPVRPDALDFRDLEFRPNIGKAPAPTWWPDLRLPVKHQGDTGACTGFSLALVVEYLLKKAKRDTAAPISSFMLYSMARRYDDIPGFKADTGSSVRAGLKGWHKHGAASESLWPQFEMPPAQADPKQALQDWWLDAVRRPLGAYYRIDPVAIRDMHAAINEVGALYVSAACPDSWNAGWDVKQPAQRPNGFGAKGGAIFKIPFQKAPASEGGHAFAIVGYNEQGFLIQNSWGEEWGTRGLAILTYDDWLVNGWDCWVAQLGVRTSEHDAISNSTTLRIHSGTKKVELSASETLRNREIAPFVVNMANNGQLSNAGQFRTSKGDLEALVDVHLAQARKLWKLEGKPLDVCIYAHGGLVGESAAASAAAQWIRKTYDNQVFPVFLMWETDFMSTLVNRLEDMVRGIPRTAAAGLRTWIERKWNEGLERLAAPIGGTLWGEMKQNAEAISRVVRAGDDKTMDEPGGRLLYKHFIQSAAKLQPVRFHLVGHSAGSIVHAFVIDELANLGEKFESVSFMAPAITQKLFDTLVEPRISDGTIKRYQQFNLSELAEEDDSCGPYRRSLLWLVSESFERERRTPILGMQTYFASYGARLKNTTAHIAPGAASQATTHGGFDDDAATQDQVLRFIRGA